MGRYSPNIMANSFLCILKHVPRQEVMVYGDRRITWEALVPRIFRIANALIALGLKKDDKVAFMFHNTPEFIELNWGIQAAGGIPAPMNYRFIPKEVQYQGDHCDARIFVYDSRWAEAVEPAAPALEKVEHFVCLGPSGLKGAVPYKEFVGSGKPEDPGVPTDWQDVVCMIYTGGTTGFPKGVMLTYGAHRDMFTVLLAHALQRALTMDMPKARHKLIVEALPIPGKKVLGPIMRTKFFKNFVKKPKTFDKLKETFFERFTDPEAASANYKDVKKYMFPSMPFFHDASYSNLVMGSMAGSLCYVLPEPVKFEPANVLGLIEKEKVETVYNVPTGWKMLVAHEGASKFDLSTVRACFTGGGACPAALKKKIMALFPNAMLFDAFGQTEMTPVASFRIDVEPDKIHDRSVGHSIVEVKVVDEQGQELPQGKVGELLYKSSTVMKGYYKDEDKTAEVMEDGWFRSGDLGYLDESGQIRTVDRKKECINTGGEKVYPLEVEEILHEHPKVADICVIGVPDEDWGSSVRAVVVLKPGEKASPEEIIEFCRGKMAGYKIPRTVVFADELPFSPVGKVLREKIREKFGKP